MHNNSFVSVSKSRPCRFCGKPDWCSYLADGSREICRRVQMPGGEAKFDKSGSEYFSFRNLDISTQSTTLTTKPIPKQKDSQRNMALIHAVYSELLRSIGLTKVHNQSLLVRGFSQSDVDRFEYRSFLQSEKIGLIKSLLKIFKPTELLQVPGFFTSGRNIRLAGADGILIPVRNLDRKIISFKIRRDTIRTDEPRYLYLSSKNKGFQSAIAGSHVPLYQVIKPGILRVTEGELKADLATVLSNELTISIPGTSAWKNAIEILYRLSPTLIKIAFDMDHKTNRQVARSLSGFVNYLALGKYNFEVETWS